MEAWLSKHQSMQTSKKGCRAWPQLHRQLQAPLGSCARTLLLKASLISLLLCRTQGLASAADKVEDNLGITKRAPILLMHGAIQGGWVWEFPRISQGAPRVRAELQCQLTLASSLPAPQAGAYNAVHHPADASCLVNGAVAELLSMPRAHQPSMNPERWHVFSCPWQKSTVCLDRHASSYQQIMIRRATLTRIVSITIFGT